MQILRCAGAFLSTPVGTMFFNVARFGFSLAGLAALDLVMLYDFHA